ncbi:MAG: 16S rRNA (cytosine(1402)-N(4))-methyltransferase RsmH [Anaerolineae bacterium]|nr:16S rRNA (cytosine(1402)-N(4))-methyltransferase RsmH [Anaerolineae bacterium]
MKERHYERASASHIPVLYQEVLYWLAPQAGQAYIDATVGLGGHAEGILERSSPDGRLLAIDVDPQALKRACQRLERFEGRVVFVEGHFAQLTKIARRSGFSSVAGILLDLGVSSLQLADPARGFSFQQDGPLDMRMGPEMPLTAEEIVNTWPEGELARLLWEYGEERFARRIARAICAERPLHTTRELADLVARVVKRRGRIHPATRTFQALRIAVNEELRSLEQVLPQAVELLAPGGRLVVISFHSLEDRIVKRFIQQESRDCICPPKLPQCVCGHVATLRPLVKKPIRPSPKEIAFNPRSRSARMRVAERLPSKEAVRNG